MSNASEFVKKTDIPGLLLIDRPVFKDERGFFREVYHLNDLEEILGHDFKGLQWNHSNSKPRVLRGLHAENWNKLIYPVSGEVFVALVDIREDSPTFSKVVTFKFNDENRSALYIPKGLANSFYVSGNEDANYLYLVDAYYDGTDTKAIAWDDPDLNIDWPNKNPILSERDTKNPKLRELFPNKFK